VIRNLETAEGEGRKKKRNISYNRKATKEGDRNPVGIDDRRLGKIATRQERKDHFDRGGSEKERKRGGVRFLWVRKGRNEKLTYERGLLTGEGAASCAQHKERKHGFI